MSRHPAPTGRIRPPAWRSPVRALAGLGALLLAIQQEVHASFLPPEVEDSLATFLALFVLFVVPVVLIVLFWMVHILPEKIAHKRHHPQFEAIRTLCLLSLVFGGLLWPIAWLWAYSKPVMYKMAYGTDKVPDAAHDGPVLPPASGGEADAVALREKLTHLNGQRVTASELKALRADLDALESRVAAEEGR